MRFYWVLIVVLLLPVATAGAAVATSDTSGSVTVSSGSSGTEVCESIDAQTSVCDARVEDEMAILTINSSINQRVTFADAGAFISGGVVTTQTRTITEGSQEVRIPVTVADGFAAVSITTPNVVYALPLKDQSSLLQPPITTADVHAAAGGAATSISLLVLFITWRSVSGRADDPERVA